MNGHLTLTCEFCGTPFPRAGATGRRARYCSRSCKSKMARQVEAERQGELAPGTFELALVAHPTRPPCSICRSRPSLVTVGRVNVCAPCARPAA